MRVIHITNGDSTRLGLERSGVPGEFHSWHDVLHSGPTPAGLARDEWRRTRAAHLASGDPAGVEWILKDYERGDAALARWREFDEMVFWFEHDLYDQLILIHHLDWLSRIDDRGATRFSLVCRDTYLGPLPPEAFMPLFERRQPIADAQVRLGREAWAAFCAPDPMWLETIVGGNTSPLPYLAGALQRHFEDYPSTRNGLSRSEAQILEAVDGGHTAPGELFAASTRREARVFMGDSTFWTIVEGLATCARPLLLLDVRPRPDRLPEGSVAITATGRDVRAGRVDHVALNGIDRWMGGVHLTTARHWRWNGSRLVTARA
jgi:hypothetical protein